MGVVPYLGAGIGMAWVGLSGVTFTNGVIVNLPARDETNLAWSLMAGLGVDIGSGIMLDVGYRYLDMGDISTSNTAIGYSLKISDLSEHQVKFGLRIPLELYRW